MVLSLIYNVNEVFNCTPKEINLISENIKFARIHYIHYKTNQGSKVLTHNVDKHQRKFIAIKVKLNGYQYFVPLSSPDFRDYYDDHGI